MPSSSEQDDDLVFGAIQHAYTQNISAVFIVVFIFIAFIDLTLGGLGKLAQHYEVFDIYRQFKYKLLVLGTISLSLFFIQACIGFQALQSFNIVLLVILFMAFCFIVEAIALVSLCKSVGQKYVEALQTPESDLLEEYQQNFMPIIDKQYRYQSAQQMLNFLSLNETKKSLKASQFWDRIEIKIIEELFVCCHGLPKEFEYGYYMSNLFIKYITNVGNVTSISWFVLAILVIINYFKTQSDNESESSQCHSSRDEFMNKSNDNVHCYQFLFTYFFSIGVVLNLIILTVYLFSVRYTRDLIYKGMSDIFDVNADDPNDNDTIAIAKPCLNWFGKPYRDQFYTEEKAKNKHPEMSFWQKSYERLGWGVSSFTQQQYIWCLHRLYTWRIEEEKFYHSNHQNSIDKSFHRINNSQKGNISKNQTMKMSVFKDTTLLSKRKSALERLLLQMDAQQGLYSHKKDIAQNQYSYTPNGLLNRLFFRKKTNLEPTHLDDALTSSRVQDPRKKGINHDEEDELIIDMDSIFWLHRPKIFFMFVDIVFLLNTFYSAVYFTQILPICVHTESAWWGVMQFLPLFFGFSMLRFILLRSVLLQTVTTLDADMAGRIIEDSIDTLTIADSVRFKIIEKFCILEEKLTNKMKIRVVKLCFQEIDTNNNGSLDKYEFRLFLGNLEVFLTKDKFNLFWKYIDTDHNGRLSRDEIMIFLFPEFKSLLKEELRVIAKIRTIVHEKRYTVKDLKEIFRIYDRDDSNTIEQNELKDMLMGSKFGIKDMTESSFKVLFAAMDADKEGNISWEEFYAVVWPSNVISQREGRVSVVRGGGRTDNQVVNNNNNDDDEVNEELSDDDDHHHHHSDKSKHGVELRGLTDENQDAWREEIYSDKKSSDARSPLQPQQPLPSPPTPQQLHYDHDDDEEEEESDVDSPPHPTSAAASNTKYTPPPPLKTSIKAVNTSLRRPPPPMNKAYT